MNKNRLYAIGVLQILCLLFLTPQVVSQGYGVKTIVIDAGHGGKDPGAVGHNCKEKDIVLKVALLTGKYIEQYLDDVKVIYTRKDDTFIELSERANIANKAKADLFISIHANAVGSTRAYGAETFVLGTNSSENNLRIAQKENSVITFEDNYEEKYEGFDPNSPESYIIFNFMQNAYQKQSTSLATLIQDQYTKRVGRKDRKVKQAQLWVLATAAMPAVLTELGFISNPSEEKFLISKEGQDFMASALFRAVRDYKHDIDSKQSITLTDAESQILHHDSIGITHVSETVVSDQTPSSVDAPIYKLQILSSPKELDANDPILRGLTGVTYYNDGATYKYTLGASQNLKDITALKKEYRQRFKGCFPVAFYNGERVSISEARKMAPEN